MIGDNQDNQSLDELLARSYEPLRRPIPGQRQAVIDGFSEACGRDRATSRPARPVRAALLALAACLVFALTVRLLLVASPAGTVYGFEAIPQRLLDVQTIRLRGARLVYDPSQPEAPPIRVPFEYLVKRPDKFRTSWVGISYSTPIVIRQGSRYCDGQNVSHTSVTEKQYATGPIAPLSAKLQTESFAQGFILSTLLGPPEAPFRKVGEEKVAGRWCHLYEGRFRNADQPAITRLWFDPTSGHPLRLIRESLQSDGTARRDEEIDEIAVNVPLADELFRLSPPEGYQSLAPAFPQADPTLPLSQAPLGQTPTSSAGGPNAKLEAWYAFKITERAALLVWRRSAPEPAADGAMDWLANVEFKRGAPPEEQTLRHTWTHQSGRADRWNWSLAVVASGELAPGDSIDLQLQGKQSFLSLSMLALRFPDDMLEQILSEAAQGMLPEGAAHASLAELRARASELEGFDRDK